MDDPIFKVQRKNWRGRRLTVERSSETVQPVGAPGGLGVRISGFPCLSPGSILGWGTEIMKMESFTKRFRKLNARTW